MKIVRVVLDESLTEANVDSAGWDLQWSIGKVIKAEGKTPKQAIYYYCDEEIQKTFIRFYEDDFIDLPFIEVYGDDPKSVEFVVKDIHDSLPTHSVPEIVAMVKNATEREELFLAMRYLGIGCGGEPATPELLEMFQKWSTNPDPDIRDTAIIAMGYAAWPEFKDILEKMISTDPVPSLRKYAAHALEGIKKYILKEPSPE